MNKFFLVLLFVFGGATHFFLIGQDDLLLKLEDIMQGEDFIGHSPQNIEWSVNSKNIYFTKKRSNHSDSVEYYIYQLLDSITSSHPNSDAHASVSRGIVDRHQGKVLYGFKGDIYMYVGQHDSIKRLTNSLNNLIPLRFNSGGDGIYYKENNNIFLWKYNDGYLSQLTNFQTGEEIKDKALNHSERWLEEQQEELFDIIKTQTVNKEINASKISKPRIKPIYLSKNSIINTTISPDGRYVFYSILENEFRKNTEVPNYMDASGFVVNLSGRPKVGTHAYQSKSYIFDRERDTVWSIITKELSGIRQKPEFLKDYHKDTIQPYNPSFDIDRGVQISIPIFNDKGEALVEVNAMDYKDRWIAILDMKSGQLLEIDRQRDEAWVGGPSINSLSMGWLYGGDRVWFLSEESGYSHIYVYDLKSKLKEPLTQGKYEVLSAQLSLDESKFYITANAEGPHEHHYYHLDINKRQMTKITENVGGHEIFISPDETQLAIRYSYSNKPWELFIMENRPKAPMYPITHSTKFEFDSYPWKAPEIIWFTASDGVKVPARIYHPNKDVKNGAAVLFVHGAGYLQNVHHWWSSYHREYMFHHFLTERGYTVLDIDYRASRGYGRDWRTAIYRHMGGRDLQDYIDGAKYLVNNHGIGSDKLGIYGGSYGGFITLMALFTSPDTFRSGAALRSVTDWAHYNHGYTSRILNTPNEDPEAYKKSSPIYHANGLKKDLLILHGMVDVNVQVQDVVRLSQRLIELKKDKWELALFPIEDHGFRYTESWLDEYKRIFSLFEKTLK